MAQKISTQNSLVSTKKPSNKKSLTKTSHKSTSFSNRAILSRKSSPKLPDLLPFLSLNHDLNQSHPSSVSPFVLRAPSVCFEDGSGSRDFSKADSGDENLMDDCHPLGDVSHQRVRLALVELGNSVRYPLQPQNKKIRADFSGFEISSSVLSPPVSEFVVSMSTSSALSPPVSEIGVSMSTCVSKEDESDDRAVDEDGIISDGCEGETQGTVRKK